MSQEPCRVHLVIPGLLDVTPGVEDLGSALNAPCFETLLARGLSGSTVAATLEATLFGLFGLTQQKDQDLPSAACARLAAGGVADEAFWLHADPVHLKPQGDRLLLFDSHLLEIADDEAKALGTLFNQHFGDDGWYLEALGADRWYLRVPGAPELVTHSLPEVAGRNIDPFLPRGGEGRHWCSVLNEVQMLFHSAEVNRKREEQGRFPINGLWFSGGGRLPVLPQSSIKGVIGDDLLLQGLAMLTNLARFPAPSKPQLGERLEGDWILFCDHLLRPVLDGDAPGWQEGLKGVEQWLGLLFRQLKQKQLDDLWVYPCNGHTYQVTASRLRHFWKRRRPVVDYLR